jgi:glycosyltransferase involved in cell wall biosynthesis
VEFTERLYVPVSLMGPIVMRRSTFFQEKFRIHPQHILILQFGNISEDRFSLELTDIAQQFPDNWHLILHGFGEEAVIRTIQSHNTHQRALLSLERLPTSLIPDMASSAHIGLVLYSYHPVNDRLTAFSSEKIALYLQCGLPIIGFAYPGYEFFEQQGCGVLISSIDQLPDAIQRIANEYDTFQANAYRCFMKYYEFSKNFSKVVTFVKNLPIHQLTERNRS